MTKQSFKDECNINKIMEKFQRTGALTHYARHAPTYGDCTPVELSDALQMVINAEQMFADLPSSIRDRFNNDPEKFLEFVQNPENLEEMRKLGLADPDTSLSETQANETPSSHAPASNDQEATPDNQA